MYFEAELKGKKFKVDVVETRSFWKISIQKEGESWQHFDLSKEDYKRSESYFSFLFKGVSYLVDVIGQDTLYTVYTRNSFQSVKIFNDEMLLHESLKRGGGMGGDKELRSGMPGKIIEIFVKPGEIVKANKPLLIMEAMKMENEMRSTGDVKVREICVKQGDSVESGAVLIKFDPV
ncbi:MAG: acetyl-CoA carboxylase biotin carboxyl carrier protein subunit [Proteobacteria bacterium]|jgi:biotin carboxyl carrier protein|nr:acetyl-CoA carboxylase biotin carboxyl carrier protein subunit [Pseudomonadota bacterium]